MRGSRLWIRLVIVMAILGFSHLYIWQRFVAATELPVTWRAIAPVAISSSPATRARA